SNIETAQSEEDPDPTPDAIRSSANEELSEIKKSVSDKVEGIVEKAETVLQDKMGGMKVDLDGDGFVGVGSPGTTSTGPQSVSSVGSMGADTGGAVGASGAAGGGGCGAGDAGGGGDVGGGGGAAGGAGSSGGPPSGPVPGNVEQWITKAIKILQENGVPVSEDNIDEIWQIIEHESAGDPHAINDWDSNAAAG